MNELSFRKLTLSTEYYIILNAVKTMNETANQSKRLFDQSNCGTASTKCPLEEKKSDIYASKTEILSS